ncbi:MAG: EAL domain-containing protein [Acidobacteriota bacterium]
MGLLLTVRAAQRSLDDYAASLLERSDAASGEARSVLAAMKNVRLPYCSHAELDQYGYLLFQSRYLRDIGHLANGTINCSSLLGPLDPPVRVQVPTYAQPDGTVVYPAIPLYQLRSSNAVTLQAGTRYVTLSPNLMASIERPGYSYFFTVSGPVNHEPAWLLGGKQKFPLKATTENGQRRFHGTLFATRCSAAYFDCATAYVPIATVLRSQRRLSTEAGGAGGFAGISLAFFITLVVERRRGLKNRFRRMMRRGGLSVAYQPIVDLKSEKTVGAEALARWTDEREGIVPPAVFLPIAAELGLAEQVTRCVVRTLLNDLAAMPAAASDFRISFNVTAPEVTGPWLLPFLQAEAAVRGISLARLAVEITEGATTDQAEMANAIFELRRHGINVYIDDFGTGYSSLAYLEFLNVDVVKIDKAFTRAIETAAVTSPILGRIVEMAESLKLQVIVEGVETAQQVAHLKLAQRDLLCQGWYFGRPMPGTVLRTRLLSERVAV